MSAFTSQVDGKEYPIFSSIQQTIDRKRIYCDGNFAELFTDESLTIHAGGTQEIPFEPGIVCVEFGEKRLVTCLLICVSSKQVFVSSELSVHNYVFTDDVEMVDKGMFDHGVCRFESSPIGELASTIFPPWYMKWTEDRHVKREHYHVDNIGADEPIMMKVES